MDSNVAAAIARLNARPDLDLITQIVAAYSASDPDGRHQIASALNDSTSGSLVGYAHKMAEDAVTTHAPDLVRRGLVALAIDGGRMDVRDCIVQMALLYHSASLLAMDAPRIFDEIAVLSTSQELSDAMRSFPLRKPEDRDVRKAFLHRGTMTRRGFRYKFCGPDFSRMAWAAMTGRTSRDRKGDGS